MRLQLIKVNKITKKNHLHDVQNDNISRCIFRTHFTKIVLPCNHALLRIVLYIVCLEYLMY